MKKIFCLFILITFTSCLDKNYNYEKQFLEKYAEGKRIFSPDLTDHFPYQLKAEKKLSISYPVAALGVGMANMVFSHQVDSTEFMTVIKKLNLNKIRAYQPTDSIFIIIGDTLDYTKKVHGIPIPNFKSYEGDFGLNSKYLTEKHTMYVLESKSGEFMDLEYLTSQENLPENWKNGFSRGIATNEKQNELIYWVCIW